MVVFVEAEIIAPLGSKSSRIFLSLQLQSYEYTDGLITWLSVDIKVSIFFIQM